MPTKKDREARRQQQAAEVETNQQALRDSIAESKRLIDEATQMTSRHRRELEADEANREKGSRRGPPPTS
jgi:hypothetical protein